MASLVLAIFSLSLSFGQQKENFYQGHIAEKIFKKYQKIGLHTGISSLYVDNEPNGMLLEFEKPRTFEIGLTYNFLQYEKFNFSISAIYRTYNLKNYSNLKKEDSGYPIDIAGWLKIGPYFEYKLNTEVQYYFNLFNITIVNISVGPELTLARKIYGTTIAITDDERAVGYTSVSDYNATTFFGANLSLGFNIKTKPLLLQPFITYHYQPKNLFTEVVTTQNLRVSENTVTKHHVTGNYILFGLKIIPSRDLF